MTGLTRRGTLAAFGAIGIVAATGRVGAQPLQPMRIGVVGARWMGGTVGGVWVKAGHEVLFSSRNPDELEAMARELGPRASVGTPRDAAAFGDVILLTVPYDALPALGRDLADTWRGKIVFDACNPPDSGDNPLTRDAEQHGAGPTTAKLLPGVRLVRVFSAVDATAVEASSKRTSDRLGVPLAGDDAQARQVAMQLVRDAGCEPLDVGTLADATVFQRGNPGFRANTTLADLRARLGLAAG